MPMFSGTSPDAADLGERALAAVDHIPAMVAYWDKDLVCRFANNAYLAWFGKTRAELLGTTLPKLLGPLYPLNRPYIEEALNGTTQVFERRIPIPGGHDFRESIATYIPDVDNGIVRGIFVHVADTSLLKQRERESVRAVAERDQLLAEVAMLRGVLGVCANCKRVRNPSGQWVRPESNVSGQAAAGVSRGLCPTYLDELLPELR